MSQFKFSRRRFVVGSFAALGASAVLPLLVACQPQAVEKMVEVEKEGTRVVEMPMELRGDVKIDGSSTVFPISEAVAEEFMKIHKDVRVTVGVSGTGGGFKKFCLGEIDISDASRRVKDNERDSCAEKDIQFIELPVAFDGLSVMVNPENDFVEHLTVEELSEIWKPESEINNWKDVRSGFPDLGLKLYGPGTDSGTFDYFTDEINGEEGASRPDYTASEDDNVLVKGIAGDKGSLGYFGYAYYVENTDKLKLVAIDGGDGPVLPTPETINNGTYAPLSRPIFIYVSISSLINKPQVLEFVKFYLTEGPALVPEVGYIQLPDEDYAEIWEKVGAAIK